MIYTVTLNPAIDYVMHPLSLDMGYTNRSSSEELHVGGNGLNICQLLNELDTPNVALGIVAGFTGDYIIKRLQEKGVSSNFVRLDHGNTRINVKLKGIVMTMVNGMGPRIPQSKVDELLDRIDYLGSGDTIVLTGSIPKSLPRDIYSIIMERLSGRGIRFVVDAPGELLVNALKSKPFLIKPNNHEIGRIFNMKPLPEMPEDVLPLAHKTREMGAQNVLVSCGACGAALVDQNDQEHIVPSAKIKLINATGAGDSMVAGFLATYDKTHDFDRSLVVASACGTATAASRGIAKRATIEKTVANLEQIIAKQNNK